MITGIQLLRRGENELGIRLIEKSQVHDSNGRLAEADRGYYSPAGEDPMLRLARSCLAMCVNDITTQDPDFAQIKARVELLVKDQPELKSSAVDRLLASLTATVDHLELQAAKAPKPGTVEHAFAAYLQRQMVEDRYRSPFSRHKELYPEERELALHGFAAIPLLLKERHSLRLTNHSLRPATFNPGPVLPMTVGKVCDGYLLRFANQQLDPENRFHNRRALDDEVVANWWKAAEKLGERQYVKRYTFFVHTWEDESTTQISWELLELAKAKYPKLLAEIYLKQLAAEDDSLHKVAQAIADSEALSRKRKRELLEMGVTDDQPWHRCVAMNVLQKLDPKLADQHLVRLIETAPRQVQLRDGTDPTSNLAIHVSKSSDAEVWKAFLRHLSASNAEMRIELIEPLEPPQDAPQKVLRAFFRIYDRYGNDPEVRDLSNDPFRFNTPTGRYPKISVGDFVQMHVGAWLRLETPAPGRDATKETWETYRKVVAKAVADFRKQHGLQK